MGPTMLPITLTTAGAAALINAWLALRVGRIRRKSGVMIGDGGDERLTARMRAQANFVEYVPLVLILIGLIEFTHGPSLWLWAVSVVFLLARIAQPFGMEGVLWCRAIGILVTMLVMIGLGIAAIATPFAAGNSRPAPSVVLGPPQG